MSTPEVVAAVVMGICLLLAGAGGLGNNANLCINTINTTGGTGGGGNVTLATATPGESGGSVQITNGAITSGSFMAVGTPVGSDLIEIGNVTIAEIVAVVSSSDVDSGTGSGNSIATQGGSITMIAGANFAVPGNYAQHYWWFKHWWRGNTQRRWHNFGVIN